jgi:hypothetical protein
MDEEIDPKFPESYSYTAPTAYKLLLIIKIIFVFQIPDLPLP